MVDRRDLKVLAATQQSGKYQDAIQSVDVGRGGLLLQHQRKQKVHNELVV